MLRYLKKQSTKKKVTFLLLMVLFFISINEIISFKDHGTCFQMYVEMPFDQNIIIFF